MMQAELFERTRLPGLVQAEAVITPEEEQVLIASIDAAGLSPFRFHSWFGKRLTASFGWNYNFETARCAPAEPIPAWLLPLRAKAAQFARKDPEDFVQALLIRYDVGAGIGWHRDRPVFEHVVGISLGAPTTMRFRLRAPLGSPALPRIAVDDQPNCRSSRLTYGTLSRRKMASAASTIT